MDTVSIQVLNGHNNLLQNSHLNVHLNGSDRIHNVDSDSGSDKTSSDGSLKVRQHIAPIDEIVKITDSGKSIGTDNLNAQRRVMTVQNSLAYTDNANGLSQNNKLERSKSVNVPDDASSASPIGSIKQRFASRFSSKRSSFNQKPARNVSTDCKATNQQPSEYLIEL